MKRAGIDIEEDSVAKPIAAERLVERLID